MLSIYNLSEKDDTVCLEKITSIHIEPTNCDENSGTGDILALSLDWNSRRIALDKQLEIVVSSSKGSVSILYILPFSETLPHASSNSVHCGLQC